MVDEVLASPQGIAKYKRLLQFSTNSKDDNQNVRKVQKRKLIPPHLVSHLN